MMLPACGLCQDVCSWACFAPPVKSEPRCGYLKCCKPALALNSDYSPRCKAHFYHKEAK